MQRTFFLKNFFLAAFFGMSQILFSQLTYTFTSAGAVGRFGPTQSDITTAYGSTNLNGLVTVNIQGVQEWTVPSSGNYRIMALGAKGGNGLGASMTGDFILTAGTVLKIIVGQPGFLGGGSSGGGGSFVVKKTATTPVVADILVIAGGGGGTGNAPIGTVSGGSDLQSGTNNGSGGNNQGCIGGGGGFLTDGNINFAGNDNGAHGKSFINNGAGGAGVSGVIGGFGGGAGMTCGPAGWNASGGGYSGGSGGGSSGGGGSSYNAGTNQVNAAGTGTSSGQVTITHLFSTGISQTSSIPCNGLSTAALTGTVTAGTAPYTYTWLPSGTNGTSISGLAAGVYTFSATDNNGLVTSTTFTVTQPAILAASVSQTNVTCFGGSDGALVVAPTGGTAPYSYTWSPSVGSTATVTSLVAGSYTCTIKDANNCTSIQQMATVTQGAAFSISGSAVSPTICNGGSTTLNGSGAATYTWTGGATNGVAFSPTATNSYSVTGANGLGCLSSNVAVVTITVHALPLITVNSGAICAGQSFTMTPGGASTYTFTGGSNIVTPASSNSYSITGTSSVGCLSSNTAVSSVTVNALPVISVNSGTICAGKSFTMVPGGALTYTYTGGSAIVTPAATTAYSVTGTSAEGCVSASPAVSNVTVIALPVVSVNSGSICAGQSFTMSPSGASTYTFSNGNAIVTPAATTSYSVTGTSSVGCISASAAVSSVTVNTVPVITVNSGAICAGETFTMIPGGANTYTFSNGSNTVSPSASSSYSVTGTSTAGCISAGAAVSNITVNALPVISVNSGTICAGTSFTITASGADTYTYTGGSAVVTPAATSAYSVTGTSTAGCISASAAVSNVTVIALPVISVNNGTICNGQSFTLVASGANTYTYSGGSIVSPTTTTSYSVTGTSSVGCVGSNVISTVTVYALPVISVNSGAICLGQSFTITPGGANTYTYSGGSSVVSPTVTASYSVTGTSQEGCLSSTMAVSTVTVNALPVITAINSTTVMCIGESHSLTAGGGLTYSWTTGETDPVIVITPTATTSYTVVGYDANGCMNSAVATQSVSECTGINSVKGTHKTLVSVYPNPNNGDFKIVCDTDISFSIINEIGQVVKTGFLNDSNNRNIAIGNLANGIYFVIGNNNDQVITRKIIVNK